MTQMVPRQCDRPHFSIACQHCGETLSVDGWNWRHSCGETLKLDVEVDAGRVAWCAGPRRGMARFAPVLPLQRVPETPVGDTPLAVEEYHGVQIGLKLEYLNPGGSFKDRGAFVTVARCTELGFRSIVVDSSGNAGVAFALMGRRAGIGVDVFLPRSAPEGKKLLLRILHARLHEVAGDRMAVHTATLEYAESTGAAYAGHWFNPYFAHGVKTMVYEAVEQIGAIDFVFCPVGAGTVLLGMLTGLSELRAAKVVKTLPRLIAVQAQGYAPVCRKLGVDTSTPGVSHLADGISIAEPPRRDEIAAAVTETHGFGAVVDDGEIGSALTWLTDRGYIVEPTSAVPLAALFRCVEDGRVPRGSRVLLPLTGSGLKVLSELAEVAGTTRTD